MKWDLTYHFKTQEDFEKAFNEAQAFIATLGSYKGKLHEIESFKEYVYNDGAPAREGNINDIVNYTF